MIEELRLAWSPEMTWDELAQFCSKITEARTALRRTRGIHCEQQPIE